MTPTFTTSKPDRWIVPRAHLDASQRYATYGKLVPLEADAPHWTHWLVRGVSVAAIGFALWMGVGG